MTFPVIGIGASAGGLEAFVELGQAEIPAIIIEATEEDCYLMSLVENLARRKHSPLELIREIDVLGHLGSVITHPVPLALLGVLLLGFSYPAILALAAAITARLWLKQRIDRVLGISGLSPRLLVPRDVLSFIVYLSSFFVRQVDWQGRRYKVHASGTLVRD